jgi:acyl-CoA reductase-like NAD-dependent aldehyde dehydrogenase
MRRIISKNPFTGQIRKEYNYLTNQQLEEKIKKAEEGFAVQGKRTFTERAKLIANMSKVFEHNEQ